MRTICPSQKTSRALGFDTRTRAVLGMTVVGPLHAETIPPWGLLMVTGLGNQAISPDGCHVAFRSERASVERDTYDAIADAAQQ